ncbi:MAG TPA: murein biosynthesis integral membrane protein MurJ [Gemmatimonadales bacterium]|nr:murein biosynthesis integral membrane protein MurJ [Gemmatimonadales bacterium]
MTPRSARPARPAALVAAGILLSRIVGLVRTRVLAHYLATSDAADAFAAAFRIPNFLQNLFGEGSLSASFIPVYAGLLARGDRKEADRVAGAVGAVLALLVSVLVLTGVLLAPILVDLLTPGFENEKRELAIRLVRILYPGAGLLVLSAWCLGILNSHGRFFLSYAAPVIWNAAIIIALVGARDGTSMFRLAEIAAWGSVVGSGLQFAVQLPAVMLVAGRLRPRLAAASAHVRDVARNFVPALVARGVVQVSAYVDALLASLLPTGALAALAYAQILYTLPVSLFGMSVSAAELPAMSGATGDLAAIAAQLRRRLDGGLREIAFHVVPSAVAFAALGQVLTAAVFQSGQFTRDDSYYVWGILAGSAVGLLASTMGRLYASAFYALRDTRTPLRFAVFRVGLTVVLGYVAALPLPPALGIAQRWGAAGLTLSAGIAGWIEYHLLKRTLEARIGPTGFDRGYGLRIWCAALAAAAAGGAAAVLLPFRHPVSLAAVVVLIYGAVYYGVGAVLGVEQARRVVRRLGG